MRILKVMPFFDPATQFGGVVSQARSLCAELAQRGHEVAVLTTDNGVGQELARDTWIERDGYRVYYARTRPVHRVVPYWTPTIAPALAEEIRATDVLTTNVGLTLMTRLAARQARRHGVPHVYNADGALCPTRLRIKRLQKAAFVRAVETPILRRVAAVQALTEKDRRDAIALGAPEERVHVIPNGVHLPPQRPRERSFERRWGIPEGAPLVLFLGRLHAIKGLDVLVESFAQCGVNDAQLVLAGPDDDGSGARAEHQAAQLGCGDRVHRIGKVDGELRDQLLAGADLFALTSRTEGLPMAVLEALAAGLPCLLSEHCNVPEVEEHGAGSVLPLDPAQISSALARQLSDPALRSAQSTAARELATERFALSHVADELEALYARVATKQGAAKR
jgi:glycosyltransferase involved in cell wall biosynthesis